MSTPNRQSWLDDTTQTPLIDEYTQKLSTFIEAMADGQIDAKELSEQERRLVDLMKQIEPQLDDALHAQVTQLLCELTAYNVMQALFSLQDARPKPELHL
jgi:uncharacterized protein YjaZ